MAAINSIFGPLATRETHKICFQAKLPLSVAIESNMIVDINTLYMYIELMVKPFVQDQTLIWCILNE